MFIQLCSVSMKHWKNNDNYKELKLLLGRISVKINPKKLKDLNEYGVYHLSSLLLVLSQENYQDESLPQHLSQLLSVSSEKINTPSHLLTSLKSCLTMCLLRVNKNQSLMIGDNIGAVIETVINKYKLNQSDVGLKRLAQDVVKIYVEALTEIADASECFSCGEETLLHR